MVKGKNILFITDSCPPNLTMSGIVVKNIIDFLINDNNIDIIAVRQSDEDLKKYKGIVIDYVKSYPYYIVNNRKKKNHTKNKVLYLFFSIKVFAFRILSIKSRIISRIGINDNLVKNLNESIEKKLSINHYDYVLCNAKPFESFEAILPFIRKYPLTKFISYQTDDFVTAGDERYMPKWLVKKKLNQRKKRINTYVDMFSIYGMLESVYMKEIKYVNSSHKPISMGIPLLLKREEDVERNNNTMSRDIRFVYAGSLVKSFRPPNECLEIMGTILEELGASMDIYHRGDCNDIIDFYQKKSLGAICNKGMVSAEESYRAIGAADVLISISNIAGDQISGKTFDYISTCKPIIHFYYDNNDMNAKVLERYPNGISVCVNDIYTSDFFSRIVNFLYEHLGNKVYYNDVLAQYAEYTVEMVVKRLFEGE